MVKEDLKIKIKQYKEEFVKIFEEQIEPELAIFEKQRKLELKNMIYNELKIILIFIVGSWLLFNFVTETPEFLFSVLFLILILIFIAVIMFPIGCNNLFGKKVKSFCYSKILKILGNLYWDTDESKIELEKIKASKLFVGFTEYISDDCFCGEYNGVQLKINEAVLQNSPTNGGMPFTSFRGIIFDVQFNKTINNDTIIYSNNDLQITGAFKRYIFIAIGVILIFIFMLLSAGLEFNSTEFYCCIFLALFFVITGFFSLFTGVKKKFKVENLGEVKLEDPYFAEKYKVYSSDQIEARYLITTAFMERFKNIQTAFQTTDVKCSFYGESLMFAISTNKNLFEIGNLFTPLNSPKQLEVFFNELISILALIDYFKLDEKTGL